VLARQTDAGYRLVPGNKQMLAPLFSGVAMAIHLSISSLG
jgi:hypothetical protein